MCREREWERERESVERENEKKRVYTENGKRDSKRDTHIHTLTLRKRDRVADTKKVESGTHTKKNEIERKKLKRTGGDREKELTL